MSNPDAGSRDVDRAALLGAALAAVVALTFGGEGEWDWMAAAAGLALLVVLAAFFRLPTGAARRGAVRAELAAVSAVAALAAALVIAAPLQAALSAGPAGRMCEASGAVAAGRVLVDDEQRRAAEQAVARLAAEGIPMSGGEALADAAEFEDGSVRGDCLGAATTRWLPLPAAGVFVLIFVVMAMHMRRMRRAAADPTGADSDPARPGHPTV
jgi:hypothetical protein